MKIQDTLTIGEMITHVSNRRKKVQDELEFHERQPSEAPFYPDTELIGHYIHRTQYIQQCLVIIAKYDRWIALLNELLCDKSMALLYGLISKKSEA